MTQKSVAPERIWAEKFEPTPNGKLHTVAGNYHLNSMSVEYTRTDLTSAVTVKPLPWRDSYGVTRADTDIGTWFLKGKIAEFSKQSFSMFVGDDPMSAVQNKHDEMVKSLIDTPPVTPYQDRVHEWILACFGQEIGADKVERNHRFLEESLELVQSLGCTQSEAHQLVDYVFGRDIGEPWQEVGGVMNTLAALCTAADLRMDECGERELARIWTKVEAIRAKQAAKPKYSPLPQHVTPPATLEPATQEVARAAMSLMLEGIRKGALDTEGGHQIIDNIFYPAVDAYIDAALAEQKEEA